MDTHVDRSRASKVSFGTALVVLGVIFLGERLGWGPDWNVARLWPLLLVGMGAIQVWLCPGNRHGYLWILTGVLLLLDVRGVLPLRDSWPLFLVAIGVSLMFGRQQLGTGGPRHGD